MVKVNFKELVVRTSLRGDKTVTIDAAADIADIVYSQGRGIAAHALALKIFNAAGEVELSDDEVRILETIVNSICAPHHIDAIMAQLKNEK